MSAARMPARRPAIAFIFITLVLDIIGIGLVIPILPTLVEHYQGLGAAEASKTYGLLHALYALMQFLLAPLLGSLSDRYGRRRVILVSLLGSGLDYFVMAFAPSLIWFAVGRVIAGITGANFAAATAYIADITPPEKRSAGFGMIGVAFGLGFIIGPVIGGWLAEFGLKIPFFVAGGLTLANWLYGLFVLPESLSTENRRKVTWERSNPIGALMALHRFPALLGLIATYCLCTIAHQVYPSTWVMYTKYRYQWGPAQVGISLAAVGVMAAIVQGGLTRSVVGWLGEIRTVRLSLLMTACIFIGYGISSQPWMIYVCIVVGSLAGLVTPAVQGLMSQTVPADEQGSLQGALTSLTSIASVIGPIMSTYVFGYFISDRAPVHLPGAAFYLSSLLALAALGVAMPALRRLTRHSEPVPESSPAPSSH